MDAKQVSNYIVRLFKETGLTHEIVAEKSGRSLSTVKNLYYGKTEDPRIDTVAPVLYVLGGSLDELYTGQPRDVLQESSISSLKEMFECQVAEMNRINEAHINNIRAHYEQHRKDFKENVEMRLADKREIIKEKTSQVRLWRILAGIGYAVLIGLLILEVTNPSLGWIKF